MLEVNSKLKSGNGFIAKDQHTFNVGKMSNQLSLNFTDGAVFGLLNNQIGDALKELLSRPSLQFDAIGVTNTILETIGRATRAEEAVVRVNINVYGSKEAQKDVGRHLSSHKVYLQRPDQQRPDSVYDNPHVLKFDDVQMLSLNHNLDVGTQRSSSSNGSEFQNTVRSVYASLTRGANLKQVEGDRRLKTELLP
jgi:SWI/SNF-related matrix-associated actin-dependent regulator of chromatin subfamily A3